MNTDHATIFVLCPGSSKSDVTAAMKLTGLNPYRTLTHNPALDYSLYLGQASRDLTRFSVTLVFIFGTADYLQVQDEQGLEFALERMQAQKVA